MAKKRSLSLMAHVHRVAWSTGWRKSITIGLTMGGLAAGTIVKVSEAWPIVRPKFPVSYEVVFDVIDKHKADDKAAEAKAERKRLDLQLDLARGKRDTARAEAYRWQDKMDEAADAEKRGLYRDRFREFDNNRKALEEQIGTLENLRNHR